MIVIEEQEQVDPICPHCDEQIQTIWMRKLRAFFGKRYIYFCPQCRKVLGISHRKGCFTQ